MKTITIYDYTSGALTVHRVPLTGFQSIFSDIEDFLYIEHEMWWDRKRLSHGRFRFTYHDTEPAILTRISEDLYIFMNEEEEED